MRLTTQTKPIAATHWSSHTLPAEAGVSDTTVLRVWRRHGLEPHRLRRGVFRSVPELTAAIEHYVAHHHEQPKPFIRTAKADDILQKVIRANAKLSSKQNEALH